jgi:2-keto-4-pentenoate hydratase/2-oxohepta-3-ene-1,7-dioic acid hydratase in catechol pathway
MKLVAYRDGQAIIGTVVDDQLHALAPLEEFWRAPLNYLQRVDDASSKGTKVVDAELLVPVPATSRVLCVGLNYVSHAGEADMQIPTAPNIFGRWASTLVPHDAQVPIPAGEAGLDWEGELAVVVGRQLRRASVSDADDAIAFCCCFNDLSARNHQTASPQWTLGKNADRSGPIGPWLVTREETGPLDQLAITTRVNGRVVQSGNTRDMVFSPAEVLAYASTIMTLQPGDVVATGTPEGVGFLRDPPEYLSAGDTVEVEIDALGTLRTHIVDGGG